MAISNIFQKQDVMRRVCYSLTPLFIYSILLYGYRPIIQVAAAFIGGILTEYLFERHRKKKVSEAVLVTCFLYGLSLPPALPIWINIVGIFFAVFIAKCVFGGFGRNVFNPAISGRLFIYLSFPLALAGYSTVEATGLAQRLSALLGSAPDAISSPTPLAVLNSGEVPSLLNLFLGLRTGSLGETAIFLIIIAAIYLIHTKTADWRPMVSTLLTATVLLTFLYFAGLMPNFDSPNAGEGINVILANLMSGSFLYMVVFMTTDPVSGPNNKKSKWYYGIIIASCTILIRVFSAFPEGVSFGIMIGNTFACWLDELVSQRTAAKKAKQATVMSLVSTASIDSHKEVE